MDFCGNSRSRIYDAMPSLYFSISIIIIILQITLTQITKKTSLETLLKTMKAHNQIWPQYLTTKIIEELNQPHVKSDGTQHTKARLREVLKEKWKYEKTR